MNRMNGFSLSETSPMQNNYMTGGNSNKNPNQNPNNVMEDINYLLSEVRKGLEPLPSVSKKQSGGMGGVSNDYDDNFDNDELLYNLDDNDELNGDNSLLMNGGARRKNKQSGGEDEVKKKREPNEYMKGSIEMQRIIKEKYPDLKGGVPMIKTVSRLFKDHGSWSNVKKYFENNSNKVKQLYEEFANEPRAPRKPSKKKSKTKPIVSGGATTKKSSKKSSKKTSKKSRSKRTSKMILPDQNNVQKKSGSKKSRSKKSGSKKSGSKKSVKKSTKTKKK